MCSLHSLNRQIITLTFLVSFFFFQDEKQLMTTVRTYLQKIMPVCGDLLLGETKIRRVPVGEVNVPHGAHALVSNNRHAFTPSAPEDMRLRRDALLNQSLPYNLFTLNCEHFATFIRYGKAVCNQVMPSLEKTSDYHLRCGNTLAFMCLKSCMIMLGHAPNENMNGFLGDLLLNLDQSITEDNLRCNLTVLDGLKHIVPQVLYWI